jgi:hypothetical protein
MARGPNELIADNNLGEAPSHALGALHLKRYKPKDINHLDLMIFRSRTVRNTPTASFVERILVIGHG